MKEKRERERVGNCRESENWEEVETSGAVSNLERFSGAMNDIYT